MKTIQFSFYFLSKKLSTELAIEVLYQQQLFARDSNGKKKTGIALAFCINLD